MIVFIDIFFVNAYHYNINIIIIIIYKAKINNVQTDRRSRPLKIIIPRSRIARLLEISSETNRRTIIRTAIKIQKTNL